MTIISNGLGDPNLVFKADATANDNGTISFAICDDRGASKGKLLQVPSVGRPRLAAAVTSCSAAT
jgi:hypothetical protein